MTEPYYQDDAVTIYHGDCREILPELGRADLILTDPPYGIGDKWTKGEMIGRNGSSRLWGKRETWDDAPPDAETLATVIAAGTQAIIWGGNYFALAGRGWLIWDKIQKFTGCDAELAWTNLDMPVRTFRLSRVEAYGANSESVKQHPTEKPIGLMRWCLGFTPDAQLILDPFMGSGTTLRAAKDCGRTSIGIELNERYCEIAAQRMGQEVLAL